MSNDKYGATHHSGETPWDSQVRFAAHSWPTPGEKPPRNRWRVPIAVTVLVLGLLVLAALIVQRANVLPAGVPVIGKDPGIAACEAIASNGKSAASTDTGGTTAQQYAALRKVFADSRYAEIRDPGVRFVDMMRQAEGMGKDAGLAALAFVGPLTESYAALSGGCAQHGYTLPALGDR